MKKKISLDQWYEIGKYHPVKEVFRPLCVHEIERNETGYTRTCKVRWPFYIAMFIPIHLINLVICLWDGGLKEFEIQPRICGVDYIQDCFITPDRKNVIEKIYKDA